MDRRGFLKLAGLGALGIAGLPAGWSLVKPGEALASTEGAPRGGKRWAMVVDMRKGCPDDCRKCRAACNKEHNVPTFADETDPKRHEIKWIWKTPYHNAFPGNEQPYGREDLEHKEVVVLCNHCVNPPCVKVCPTQATYQRPDGIVMMDFHRCIGCRFCMAGCPYGSRSFNWRDPRAGLPAKVPNPAYPTRMRGVVEKCTFCSELLDKGQQPACVVACTEKLLAFGDLESPDAPVRELLKKHFTIRRKPNLGTQPQVYYIIGDQGGAEHA
jgi:molybdopterin-containing oxidoreductase family iron-sulfur binding subunit